MENLNFIEKLRNMPCDLRFDLIYGPGRGSLERNLGCRILTLPIDQIEVIPENSAYVQVSNRKNGAPFLAVMESTKKSTIQDKAYEILETCL